MNAIFSRTLGQRAFNLAGNYNAIVSPVVTFQREVFLKTFFSLFSEAIVLQNRRNFTRENCFIVLLLYQQTIAKRILRVEDRVY